MNILVTGGAGYIGSKVSLDLLDKGHKVFIVDNLSTGKRKLIPKKSIFCKTDISNVKKISNIINQNSIEAVFHFAAYTSVPDSFKKPKVYYKNNYIKSKIFIKSCLTNHIKYFIHSSTAAIYKEPKKKIKIKENDQKKPKSPYGFTKFMLEKYIKSVKKQSNFCILRYFNVAGADQKLRTGQINDNLSMFKNLSKSIVKKKDFKINGKNYLTQDGTAVRDYIHLEDLSDIHLKALNYLKKNKIKDLLILNCGYGQGYSVKEIVSIAQKKYNFNFTYQKKRRGDLPFVVANCNNLKKKLKWRPKFNSVKKMIDTSVKWEKKL